MNADSRLQVLALFGSPRAGGNSDALLEALLAPAPGLSLAVERVRVPALKLGHCRGCHQCEITGNCVQHDDMEVMIPKLLAARWIVLSSPVFFYGFPAQTKALVDRSQVLWARRYRPPGRTGPIAISEPGRQGFLIVAGATRGKELFRGMQRTAHYFFDAVDVSDAGMYAVQGVESRGDAAKTEGALDAAREAGERLFSAPATPPAPPRDAGPEGRR